MRYQGSCHCGKVLSRSKANLPRSRVQLLHLFWKGSLLWGVLPGSFRLLSPEAELATYSFGKERIKHRFCPHCGIHTFAEGISLRAPGGHQRPLPRGH